MDFYENEDKNGIRYSWNVFPSSKLELSQLVVPLGALYTPLKQTKNLLTVNYNPVSCRVCKSILNPYCQVNYQNKTWICPFCHQGNNLPKGYHSITPTNLPAELFHTYTTLEYKLSRAPPPSVCYLFVIDLCTEPDEFEVMKERLLEAIALIPENAIVGVITFDRNIRVHELTFSQLPKSHIIRGDKRHSTKSIKEMLGLPKIPIVLERKDLTNNNKSNSSPYSTIHRALQKASNCEFVLSTLIEQLQPSYWPVLVGQRPDRAVGNAIHVAETILSSRAGAGRIVALLSGAGTVGPGSIVGFERTHAIRSHHDLLKGNAKYTAPAKKFYHEIAERASQNSHSIDIFSVALDQIGLFEMISCPRLTGGCICVCESYKHENFKKSLNKLFQPNSSHFDARIQVKTSQNLQYIGCLGNCFSANPQKAKKKPTISLSGTNVGKNLLQKSSQLRISTLTNNQTFAFQFDLVKKKPNQDQNEDNKTQQQQQQQKKQNKTQQQQQEIGLIQYRTLYQHNGEGWRVRVTTTAHRIVSAQTRFQLIKCGFDQEAAAVIIARESMNKTESAKPKNVVRWLDKNLISFSTKFGTYVQNQPRTFQLEKNFSLFPQFMFNLRKSPLLKIFGYSPDETTFHKHCLFQENVQNSILMFQPMLFQYSMKDVPKPVLLDSSSVQKDCLLLLDTFFVVLIWRGKKIAKWAKLGYQEQEEYKDFKALLQMPIRDSYNLLNDRFPSPRFIQCNQGTSQARLLQSRVNYSQRYTTSNQNIQQLPNLQFENNNENACLTDDVSFQVFMSHLKKFVCQN
ncbi:protein transport protein sec23 [Anaeramoeba flamelloides]|uniref:Protein transport protein SEC23 n=1 Tax=Anaeramoeba flamelloides TaxID=1746091 RepID=A0ABQ8XCI3_9EUKA|nr:protein transport protein sec23 [Anaeramoeba flamelloides]